jgi:leucyl aminopeptidase
MPPASPIITASPSAPASLDTDLLVVPVFSDESAGPASLDEALARTIARSRESGELRGKPFEMVWLHIEGGEWRCRRVLAIGAGPQASFTAWEARRIATAAGLAARKARIRRLAWLPPDPHDEPMAQAATEGLLLAALRTDRYRTDEPDNGVLEHASIVVIGDPSAIARAVDRGRVLGESSNLARQLSNEPANLLTPRIFAERAADAVAGTDVVLDVLEEKRIESLRLGLLMGVARGSSEPPRLVVMRYAPPGVTTGPVLGLVGKGVTFDTGGISIKPSEGMEKMKHDMTGGASVVAAMTAIARLGAPIRVLGVVPATENMPGGRAIKPGDVLTSASGKTVEVLNTDAEGRLILADALWYARELGATHLVDVATLTGACVVALGRTTSGLFGTPDWWVDMVRQTGDRVGDRLWPMPLFDEYNELLKSDVADLQNIGGRAAGAITAAAFLRAFAGDVPWAHLDIAGTAWADEPKPYQPKGATGVSVRTLAELAFTSDRWNSA